MNDDDDDRLPLDEGDDRDDRDDVEDMELGELDWDDALAEWEDELDDSAESVSGPMPQNGAAPAARPLYRPPSPDEGFTRPRSSKPPKVGDPDDPQAGAESTRIASIPEELIKSLVGEDARRANASSDPVKTPVAVDLELDGILDDELGLPARPVDSGIFDPFAEPESDEVVASFDGGAKPDPTATSAATATSGLAKPKKDLGSEPAAAPRAKAGSPSLPRPRIPRPPSLGERPPGPPRPPIPKPGTIPRPSSRLGGKPTIPRPPRPAVPRPAVPSPAVPGPRLPGPGAPRPARLKLPLPPKPSEKSGGGLGLRERLGLPARPASIPPPIPGAATRTPEDTSPASDLELDEPGLDLEKELDSLFEAEPTVAPLDLGIDEEDEEETLVPITPEPETHQAAALPDDDDVELSLAEEPTDDEGELSVAEKESDDEGELSVAEEESDDELSVAGDDGDAEVSIARGASDDAEPSLAEEDDEGELSVAGEESDDAEPSLAEEDDEGELSVAGEESDDAEVSVGEDDEDDEDEIVFAAGDDDADDEDWAQIAADEEAADAAAAAAAQADRGALAARRSVRSRKPRDEVFPMIGDSAETLRLRKRLLVTVAQTRTGATLARILVSAAELAEQLGEVDEAVGHYGAAIEADPGDVVAIRALRRHAVTRGQWDQVGDLFEREAALELSAWERATALNGLAEILLTRLDDAKAAATAAEKAQALQPASVVAALLLAEARWRLGLPNAVEALGAVRDLWDDPDARAAIAVEEARLLERAGSPDAARELYAWANEVDPEALDGWLGRARTSSRAGADPEGAVEALATVAAYCPGPVGEAISTRASRVATHLGRDPQLGVRLLAEAGGVLPLQARAEAAAAVGDPALELEALGAWARAAGGTDRALALVRLAEVRAAEGDLDGAEAALRDAALADGSLGTIRVVREVIVRRSGDVSRLADAGAGGALRAAARVARDPESLPRERELLEQAAAEGEALVAADVLFLDVVSALGDHEAFDEALRRQAERVPPEHRVGSLLLLTERAIESDDLDEAEALLSEARKHAPGNPLVIRPLGRLVGRRDAQGAAALWLEEASTSADDRAAYAATQAGRVLALAGGDALGALRRALEAMPGYGPAAWLLRPLATELGDPLTLGQAHQQLAEHSDPLDAAGHLARGALLRAEADPAGARELLASALEGAPDDVLLQSLVMRLAGAGASAERAAMLARAAESTEGELARVFRLQAAAAFEEAGEPARAAAEYRAVAEAHPGDPVASISLDRAEIAAGEEARVASRRFAAVKAAESDEERVLALERLADLDESVRQDPASAVLSRQSILEISPGHLPSLRALSRYFSEQNRLEEATAVLATMAEHVAEGPDVSAYLRLARRLAFAPPDAPGEAADEMLRAAGGRAALDLWLAPRVLAAAEAGDDLELAYQAADALAHALSSPEEVASMRLRVAELLAEDADASQRELAAAVEACPSHPLAAEALAHTASAHGDHAAAAAAFETAARNAEVRVRAAELYYRAALIYEERLEDPVRARAALEPAAERDITYSDVFDRLNELLTQADDHAALANLYTTRLAAGGDTPELVELYVKQAELKQRISDPSGAKAALRSALALQPERVDALRSLANLCLDDEDWRGAAEVLIRIARVRKEREELRWVFFTLGDIYDQHMPDPRRAEAAFNRVLKLLPQDVPAMERLASIYERDDQLAKAAEMLEELARVDVDADANRGHRIRLASLFENLGDARKAEQVLDEARKQAPTDLTVLRTLADFYRRQEASNALAMHLSRAVSDFRHALAADLGDAAAWPGLVEVLGWRGASDAAAVAASAAHALGVVDVETSKIVDANGGAPAARAGAASDELDELLAPPLLGAPTRAVFRLAGEALEKSLPFDVAAYHAEKIGARDTSIRPIAQEIGRWFGVGDPQLYVTSAAPRVCVPVYSNPVTILIGSELLGITDEREKAFVLVRAFKIAKAQLSVVVRAQPHEVLALLGGLVQSYDPQHAPTGVDPAHVAEASRRVTKNVSARARDELGPLVFEMAGRPGYDPSSLAMAASEWGNRVALVATGSAVSAVSALAKLSGEREMPSDPSARLAVLQRFPEASSLLSFAVSDTHFESRRRAGIEGK